VVFSFIVYKSRAHRDKVNAKVMKDKRISEMCGKDQPMPFDVKRMAYGGFEVIVEA
jgi:alkaline phosphatase